jgi:heme-degrading monooxygenase HmoA
MVVLINSFEVDPSNDEPFLAAWRRASDVMEQRPGFIRTRLHRALAAGPRFVNIAEWESQDAFAAALTSPAFRDAAQAILSVAAMTPALYEIAYESRSRSG